MTAANKRTHLLHAVRRVLRSIARLLIRVGVRYEEFSALAKGVYVESAVRDGNHVKPISRARVAIFTGLTRRDVNFYIDSGGATPERSPTSRAQLVEILHKWHTEPDYVGPYGIPRELQFSTPPDRCFGSLVALCDITSDANAVLVELMNSGAVAKAGDNHYRAVSRFLMVPDTMSPEMIDHYGDRMSRLAATLEYNLDPRHSEKRLDRRVVADKGLSISMLPAFESYARGKAVDFLLELDNWVSTRTPPQEAGSEDDLRVGAGVNVFLFVDAFPQDFPERATETPVHR